MKQPHLKSIQSLSIHGKELREKIHVRDCTKSSSNIPQHINSLEISSKEHVSPNNLIPDSLICVKDIPARFQMAVHTSESPDAIRFSQSMTKITWRYCVHRAYGIKIHSTGNEYTKHSPD